MPLYPAPSSGGGISYTNVVSPSTLSSGGTTHNIDFGASPGVTVVRITLTTTGHTITGIKAGVAGDILVLVIIADAGTALVLSHQSASSTDVNRLINGSAGARNLVGSATATYMYDGTTQRWREIANSGVI